MIPDYIATVARHHGMEQGEPDGVRVIRSVDVPGAFALQIRYDGAVVTARLTLEQLAELHRQASQ